MRTLRAYSSAGRASALQAEGHRFEPYYAHHFFKVFFALYKCGLVVQLVRMPACHAGGRRFEPVPGRQFLHTICWCGSTVEQLICNQQVGGSIPSTSSIYLATDDTLSQITRLSLKSFEGFPSGQRGRTVNPLAELSMVRIHLPRPFFQIVCMRKWLRGRASPCQGEGREFESRLPLQFCADVVQW